MPAGHDPVQNLMNQLAQQGKIQVAPQPSVEQQIERMVVDLAQDIYVKRVANRSDFACPADVESSLRDAALFFEQLGVIFSIDAFIDHIHARREKAKLEERERREQQERMQKLREGRQLS